MLSILFFIALCGKLSFATLSLNQFNRVAVVEQMAANCNNLYEAIHSSVVYIGQDMKTLESLTPEERCAEECVNAQSFCKSFVVVYVKASILSCYTFAFGSANILPHFHKREDYLRSTSRTTVSSSPCLLRSLYDINIEPDYVTSVLEITRDFIDLGYDKAKFINKVGHYCRPDVHSLADNQGNEAKYLTNFIDTCRAAALKDRANFPTISNSEQPTDEYLDRKSVISALKSWISPNPQYSTNVDQLVLMFLKLYGPSQHAYSSSEQYYFTMNQSGNRLSRAIVVSFGPGHYITITSGYTAYDTIKYISADGTFAKKVERAQFAASLFRRFSGKLGGGTTGLRSQHFTGKHHIDCVGITREPGISVPQLQQLTAMAVVNDIISTLYDGPGILLEQRWTRDLVTFVLSWVYKVRQSDVNFEAERDLESRGPRIMKSFFPGSASMVDIITQS